MDQLRSVAIASAPATALAPHDKREFSIEEICKHFGVEPGHLMSPEKFKALVPQK